MRSNFCLRSVEMMNSCGEVVEKSYPTAIDQRSKSWNQPIGFVILHDIWAT